MKDLHRSGLQLRCIYFLLLILLTSSIPLQAEEKKVFDPDKPPETNYRLARNLFFGARIDTEYTHKKNFDLNNAKADDLSVSKPSLGIGLSYIPMDRVSAYLALEPALYFYNDERGKKKDITRLQVTEAFVELNRFINKGLSVRAGRQRYHDKRQWLFDEELDALRVSYQVNRLLAEFSVAELNDKDLLNDSNTDDILNMIVLFRYAIQKKNEVGMYCIIQDDRGDTRQNPVFLGIQVNSHYNNLDWWLEAAHVSGKNRSMKIRAYGYDIGGTYVWDIPWEPSMTLAYAYASGDDDPSDGRDRSFRQTGYQDNEARLNGLIRLKSYGEIFDPELSNLRVLTWGCGIRPSAVLSIDFLYHYSQQNHAANNFRDVGIKAQTSGDHKNIGYEMDLGIGYQITENMKSSLISGFFHPGSAFSNDADPAYFFEWKMRYVF
jgi:alginate production protein